MLCGQIAHNGLASSRQRESHPKPLTEPCLIVSHHTALVVYKSSYKLNRKIQFPVIKQIWKLFLYSLKPRISATNTILVTFVLSSCPSNQARV